MTTKWTCTNTHLNANIKKTLAKKLPAKNCFLKCVTTKTFKTQSKTGEGRQGYKTINKILLENNLRQPLSELRMDVY